MPNVALMSSVHKNNVLKFAFQEIKGYMRKGKLQKNLTGCCTHLGLKNSGKMERITKENKSIIIPENFSTDLPPEVDRLCRQNTSKDIKDEKHN